MPIITIPSGTVIGRMVDAKIGAAPGRVTLLSEEMLRIEPDDVCIAPFIRSLRRLGKGKVSREETAQVEDLACYNLPSPSASLRVRRPIVSPRTSASTGTHLRSTQRNES